MSPRSVLMISNGQYGSLLRFRKLYSKIGFILVFHNYEKQHFRAKWCPNRNTPCERDELEGVIYSPKMFLNMCFSVLKRFYFIRSTNVVALSQYVQKKWRFSTIFQLFRLWNFLRDEQNLKTFLKHWIRTLLKILGHFSIAKDHPFPVVCSERRPSSNNESLSKDLWRHRTCRHNFGGHCK